MAGVVRGLFHYPVKGLSAQALAAVDLVAGEGFPLDRAFGFARAGSPFDPANPRPLPKGNFVVLARDAGLARLRTRFDAEAGVLEIAGAEGAEVFDIRRPEGAAAAARALAAHLGYAAEETPALASAGPHRFTDVSVVSEVLMNAVSLINLDSVAELSRRVGREVDPGRFRGNILVAGVAPFAELGWVGRELRIGEVRLRVVLRTKRCPATEVNLETGERDMDVPGLLRRHFGHSDMGVYCEVLSPGRISPGDALEETGEG